MILTLKNNGSLKPTSFLLRPTLKINNQTKQIERKVRGLSVSSLQVINCLWRALSTLTQPTECELFSISLYLYTRIHERTCAHTSVPGGNLPVLYHHFAQRTLVGTHSNKSFHSSIISRRAFISIFKCVFLHLRESYNFQVKTIRPFT